nr:hypothetical protein [Rickettsia montanensis]
MAAVGHTKAALNLCSNIPRINEKIPFTKRSRALRGI